MKLIVIGFIIANVLASFQGFKNNVFFNNYKFNVLKIQQGEKIRLFSSGFLHVDYIHLIFNMYALYLFSGTVLIFFSTPQYVLIYGLSLLAGNYLSLQIHKKDAYYSAVGASGAVTGIVFSSIVLLPNMSLYLMFIPIPIPAYIFGVGYLFYSIYGMNRQIGNVGHSAHIGGAIVGFIGTLILKPNVLQTHPLQICLLAVPILFLLIMQKKNLFQ